MSGEMGSQPSMLINSLYINIDYRSEVWDCHTWLHKRKENSLFASVSIYLQISKYSDRGAEQPWYYNEKWQRTERNTRFIWIVYPKMTSCHHLLTLKLFQTCMNFFLLLLTVDPILTFFFHSMGVNGAMQSLD